MPNTSPTEQELREDVRSTVRRLVRAGFLSREDIRQAISDITYESADRAALEAFGETELTGAWREQRVDEQGWAERTDCDRLDAAFADLEAAGIVARQDFLCCQTCGCAEMPGEFDAMRASGRTPRGYAFYHAQDTERGVEGAGVYLSFGDASFDDGVKSVAIAQEIVDVLRDHGLQPEWNGTFGQRIRVPLAWRRRRFTCAPAAC
jgi:hypothetical protein